MQIYQPLVVANLHELLIAHNEPIAGHLEYVNLHADWASQLTGGFSAFTSI